MQLFGCQSAYEYFKQSFGFACKATNIGTLVLTCVAII